MKKTLTKSLKSKKGFAMQDLLIACFIFILFTGLIGALMYQVYEINVTAALTSQMSVYAVQILEDLDKISYEEAQNKTAADYREQFQIPGGFGISLQLSDYGEEEGLEDVLKIVDLRITFEIGGRTEEFSVRKLKVREL